MRRVGRQDFRARVRIHEFGGSRRYSASRGWRDPGGEVGLKRRSAVRARTATRFRHDSRLRAAPTLGAGGEFGVGEAAARHLHREVRRAGCARGNRAVSGAIVPSYTTGLP
jgi:hypothetical protein